MKRIFKYDLEIVDEQHLILPHEYEILTVQPQGEKLCLWAMVNSESSYKNITIRIHGTGHPIASEAFETLKYISTVQMYDGSLVLHCFELVGQK